MQCVLDDKIPVAKLFPLEQSMGALCSKLLELFENTVHSCAVSITVSVFF